MSSIDITANGKPVGSGRSFGPAGANCQAAIIRSAKGMVACLLVLTSPVVAQDDREVTPPDPISGSDQSTEPARSQEFSDGSQVIDILASADDLYGPPPPVEDCSEEQEAAIISGEIIVCWRNRDQRRFQTLDPDSAQARYAEETAFRDDPRTPDFILDCHDQGMPFGCVSFGKVPPPALIIDVAALPQAPAGSDADRISRGLPPLGGDDSGTAPIIGLPERPLEQGASKSPDQDLPINSGAEEEPVEEP